MYAKPRESQRRSSVSGAGVWKPKWWPSSVMRSSVPSGQAMKKKPVIAKPIASRRRFRTTKRSAFSPVIGGRILFRRLGRGSCRRSRKNQPLPMILSMIEREQVEHVAKLARLKLTDDEVQRMAGELSGILEHVERISKLDLDGVEPTSHVIALENVLRPDEPRPSWERDEMLERAPDPESGGYRVPSPQA